MNDSTCKTCLDWIDFAETQKQGIYSDESEVPPDQLIKEAKNAEEEFALVLELEHKRIKLLVDEENKRIMNLRGKLICPLCLEDIPALSEEGDRFISFRTCCGVCCHAKCMVNWETRRNMDQEMSQACFYCRKSSNADFESLTKLSLNGGTFGRAYALNEIGKVYEYGGYEMERNLSKALKSYKEAAELGNHYAQAQISYIYYNGHFQEMIVPKYNETAKDMALRAVDQGNLLGQCVLGSILTEGDMGEHSASFRLFSLGAYQGNLWSFIELEKMYSNLHKRLESKENKCIQEEDKTRKYLFLSLYWAGKVYFDKREMSKDELMSYFHTFASHLDKAMVLWHKRLFFTLEPLTGYSHIPLIARNFSKISIAEWSFTSHSVPWKYVCVNCGNRNKDTLEVCAHCGGFSYCSEDCKNQHWREGHKMECQGHWIERYITSYRTSLE